MTAYNRPITATLHVHLANGETWEAKPEDLEKFHLVNRSHEYVRFDEILSKILDEEGMLNGDITNTMLNPVRHLVECVLAYPAKSGIVEHDDHLGWADVKAIEYVLRQHAREVGEAINDFRAAAKQRARGEEPTGLNLAADE